MSKWSEAHFWEWVVSQLAAVANSQNDPVKARRILLSVVKQIEIRYNLRIGG